MPGPTSPSPEQRGPSPLNCWPTPPQRLLLRAALLQDDGATSAWRAWRSAVDLDRLDAESVRMLGLLYGNLVARGIADPLLGRLRGIHRDLWLKNQLRLRAVARPLAALADAGLEIMLLKGSALLLHAYASFGLRAVADVDVLVRVERVGDALALLERLGWRPIFYNGRARMTPGYLATEHAVGLRNPAGEELDLHWHVMPECVRPGADESFWQHAAWIEHQGLAVRVLDDTDQLLHVLAHGIKFESAPKLRWAADALTILRKPGTRIDWERFVGQTRELRLVAPVREGLAYLRQHLAAPIPSAPVRRLDAVRLSAIERFDHHLRTTAHDLTFVNVLARMWFWHRRLSPTTAPLRLLATFPQFTRRYYELDHLAQLPAHALARGVARIRRRPPPRRSTASRWRPRSAPPTAR